MLIRSIADSVDDILAPMSEYVTAQKRVGRDESAVLRRSVGFAQGKTSRERLSPHELDTAGCAYTSASSSSSNCLLYRSL